MSLFFDCLLEVTGTRIKMNVQEVPMPVLQIYNNWRNFIWSSMVNLRKQGNLAEVGRGRFEIIWDILKYPEADFKTNS